MNYRFQAVSVNTARAIYALNWFDIAPGLTYISRSLNLQIVQLGIITTGFYLGLASFQLLGGVFASRIGNRRTETMGLLILGMSVIGSGLATNLPILFTTRFMAGLGSAFFFSPALGMLSEIVPDEKYNFYIGAFNGSFNIGAGIGVLGWVYIDQTLGWRLGLVIGGILTVAIALENFIVLRGVKVHTSRGRDLLRNIKVTLSERSMWILPIAGIGSMIAETIMGQLFVFYSENGLGLSQSASGSIAFAFLIIGFAGGVLGGYQYGRTKHKNMTLVGVLSITGVLLVAIPFLKTPLSLGVLVAALGMVVVDGFSILYAIAARLAPDRSTISFSLSFVNFMQQAIGAVFPFIFTTITFFSGYTVSWVSIGLVSLFPILLLSTVTKNKPGPANCRKNVTFNNSK